MTPLLLLVLTSPFISLIKSLIHQLFLPHKTIDFICVYSHVSILDNKTADSLATSINKIIMSFLLKISVPDLELLHCKI